MEYRWKTAVCQYTVNQRERCLLWKDLRFKRRCRCFGSHLLEFIEILLYSLRLEGDD